jgi:hypothetical protein
MVIYVANNPFSGPALQRALEAKFPGQVSSQGIRYPADISGAVTGAISPSTAKGSIEMTRLAKVLRATGHYLLSLKVCASR